MTHYQIPTQEQAVTEAEDAISEIFQRIVNEQSDQPEAAHAHCTELVHCLTLIEVLPEGCKPQPGDEVDAHPIASFSTPPGLNQEMQAHLGMVAAGSGLTYNPVHEVVM